MAATLTTTVGFPTSGRTIRTVTLAWVSHTDGVVDLDTGQAVVGEIVRVVFKPNSAGTQPSDLYDVLLKDAHGIDVLAGQGANLSNANTTQVCPGVPMKDGTTTSVRPCVVSGILNLEVSNAGSGKGGSVILYLR
jgi:hypothetical protein